MTENLKYILGILVAVIVLIIIGYFIFGKKDTVTHSTSNSKTNTTEEIKTTQNTFTIEQVGQIKKVLTDSLSNIYGSIINRLKKDHLPFNFAKVDTDKTPNYSYISEIDTNLVVKDSAGSITDNLKVISTFISPIPITDNSVHLIKLDHTSFRKEKSTVTTTVDSVFIKENKNFWERFTLSPNISAGYGLLHRQLDFYAGIGVSFEFNAFEIFFK